MIRAVCDQTGTVIPDGVTFYRVQTVHVDSNGTEYRDEQVYELGDRDSLLAWAAERPA